MIEVCNECSSKSIFSKKEKSKKIIIKNVSRVRINEVKVDKCLIEDELKCDWLYEIECDELEKIYYVELKGKDINHALKQIINTIDYCEKNYGHKNCNKYACVVLSRYPKEDSTIQNKKRELNKRKIKFKPATYELEIKI